MESPQQIRACLHRDDGGVHCLACGCILQWVGGSPDQAKLDRFKHGEPMPLVCPKCRRKFVASMIRNPVDSSSQRSLIEEPQQST